jgi:dihydrofolate reductase
MAKLIYLTNVSLDGYIEDEHGDFTWGAPDDELFAYITELARPLGTHLYGRRLYETMAVWETDPAFAAESELMADFAGVWQAADKVVYSTTLEAVSTERTRIERTFDPAAVREMKESATSDFMIGGAQLAGEALRAGVVDEIQLLVRPILLGGGKPFLPGGTRVDLELLEERQLSKGVVHVRHRVAN